MSALAPVFDIEMAIRNAGTPVLSGPACECHTGMDIRGRCCPLKDPRRFARCRARVDTFYFCIKNDYDTYKLIQDCYGGRQGKYNIIFQLAKNSPYGLTFWAGEEKDLIELIEEDEMNEGDFNCHYCDEFVPLKEQTEGAGGTYNFDTDEPVCGRCCPEKLCGSCDCWIDKDEEPDLKAPMCGECVEWVKE